MPSNNSKYSEEMREQTAKYIIESGKSATSVSEELGVDTNTVCRWVRDYRRKHKMPSYAESKGIKQATQSVERDLMRKVKERDKRINELEEEVDILKKSLRIFMQPPK